MDFALNLEIPWDIALHPTDDSLLVTERPGRLRRLDAAGQTIMQIDVPGVASVGEGGLTGIALHPQFISNGFLYLYYSYRDNGIWNRVSRFRLTAENQLTEQTTILDRLPGGSIHNGGRLRFGPDTKLWVLTGDGGASRIAQDPQSFGGKVLRINDDGSIPSDNPTSGSPVYSFGHRNPQGLDWHPETRDLVVTEHGQSAYDEINVIRARENYGWPTVRKCASTAARFISPLLCSGNQTWAPSGGTFLPGSPSQFTDTYFFAGLRGSSLQAFDFVDGEARSLRTIIDGSNGRLRAVTAGRDGRTLFVSTSNRDGRGTVRSGDDRILKVTLEQSQQ